MKENTDQTEPKKEASGAPMYYLFVSSSASTGHSAANVFYVSRGDSVTKSLLDLFSREYGDGGRLAFYSASAATFCVEEQILFNEALDALEIYAKDADPGIYDPPPPRETLLRAQYSVRAQGWEKLLGEQMRKTVGNTNTESRGQESQKSADALPQMSPEEKRVSASYVLMHLVQAYYRMIEAATTSGVSALDLELNESYFWTVRNITNLLKNHDALKDFPDQFEPIFADLYPSTVIDAEWQDMVGPLADRFLSSVQWYIHAQGLHEPEKGSLAWIFIELFKPGVELAIQRADSYNERMREHARRILHPNRSKSSRADSSKDDVEPSLTMLQSADFVIITPLNEEREAMLRHLKGAKRLPPTDDDIRVYYHAHMPIAAHGDSSAFYTIVLTDSLGMGRVEAANVTGDAIRRWRPKYVILVGIAGGLAKAGVNLGDVLISDLIADYELQKLKEDETQIRWSVHRASPRLLIAAKQLKTEEWQPLIGEERPEPGTPQRHEGPICTGDKVVANGMMDCYQAVWKKLIGVEMEGGGAASAAFQSAKAPDFFMIRAVSDLADAQKDHTKTQLWRPYACNAAAAFTVALLRSGPVPTNPK
jgi:nucleoside phosphorylase